MPLRRVLLISLFCIFSSVILYSQHDTDTMHILYLNSYDHRMNWPEAILEGIEDVLQPESNNINLHYEALDSKEFHSDEYFNEYRRFLELKYDGYQFSLIFCSDNNAFDFLLKSHRDLYPGVPVVFCGVNNFKNSLIASHKEFTGIMEVPSTEVTVELMLRLHPDTEEIYIINDYLKTGRAWQRQIEADLRYLEGRIKLIYSENLSSAELQQKIASLSDKSLILSGVYFTDRDGLFSSYEEMSECIAAYAEVPFYTLVDFNIQPGVIGGSVISGYAHGVNIAKIGLRILAGESPEEIEVVAKEYNRFIFNYPELVRFSISEKDLPDGSEIINRPFSVYEAYKVQIWFLIIIIVILSIVILALILTISRRNKAEKENVYLQSLWEGMFKNSVEAIFIQSASGRIEKVNDSLLKITGFSEEELIDSSIDIFKGEYLTPVKDLEIYEALQSEGRWAGELVNRRKSGEVYSLWISLSYFNDHLLSERKTIGVFHDISHQKKYEEELKWMSHYDALTGFSKRTFFLDMLGSELRAAERSGEICAVMLLNIDGLNNINNTYGFIVGDKIIGEFSKRLKSALREEDIVSRFGGDEFAVLSPRFSDRNQVSFVIKRIREKVLTPIRIENNSIDLSVSIGISLFPTDGTDERELIARAGTALKRTKTNRKGSYSLFNSEHDKAVIKNSELEMLLHKSLTNNELNVFYQPKVDPASNRINGFEALIRWHKNHEEWVPPGIFIPISEDTGFIIEIGYFVITKACDFILYLTELGYSDFHVGVNISAKQFSDPDFIDNLIRIVEELNIPPSYLDLEVTESITASRIYNAIECLSRLSDYGFSISIDDFGTGYSSLQYLLTLPFDTIKIDKSFIDSILDAEVDHPVLDTMISLSHSLKKSIVAEGAETAEQVDYLKKSGCELIQGYYYSRPLPVSDITELLESEKLICL